MKAVMVGISLFGLMAGASASVVEPPAGFGVVTTHRLQTVIVTERVGALPNGVQRATLEQVCRNSAAAGATTGMPVFEPGADEPLPTRTLQFLTPSADQRASFTEVTGYSCTKADLKALGPCGCTYRRHPDRQIEVTRWKAGRLQRWQVRLDDGTGTLDESASPSPLPARAPSADVLTRLFGAVTGTRTVAGVRCEQRELPTASTLRQTCLALPNPKLPEAFWGRALATSSRPTGAGASGIASSSEVQRLELSAEVDAGVFEPPAGITYRAIRRPPAKEFTP